MDLSHSFSVPTSLDATWEHFQDIGALAECFPGAQVTAVGQTDTGAPTFEGTCKVKLGPIALVYAGSGQFVETDEAAHRFVVEAKGRDKRGNGTAGATVTVSMADAGSGTTQVDVVTDLAITGKPAQFGRGVMQDVSDKLLGQFVSCLEQRLADSGGTGGTGGTGGAAEPAASAESAGEGSSAATPPSARTDSAAAGPAQPPAAADSGDDALDLGAAVFPILLKTYGKQIAAVLGALVVLRMLLRRRR